MLENNDILRGVLMGLGLKEFLKMMPPEAMATASRQSPQDATPPRLPGGQAPPSPRPQAHTPPRGLPQLPPEALQSLMQALASFRSRGQGGQQMPLPTRVGEPIQPIQPPPQG